MGVAFANRRSLTLAFLLAAALMASGCSYMPSWMGGKKKEIVKLPGDRIAVLPVDTSLQPDEALKNTPPVLPAPAANADWPQHSGFLTPAAGNLAGGSFDTITHATIGEGNEFIDPLVPQPVVAGGLVFALDGAGTLSAHNAADISKIRWHNNGVSEEDAPPVIGGGLAFDNGMLYAVSGRGMVAAFEGATGKELWRKALHVPLHSAPKAAGGKLFLVSLDNQLYTLNASSGEVLWTQRGISETAGMMNSVSPAVTDNIVIVPYLSGELYALSIADGKEIWNDSLSPRSRTQAGGVFSGIGGDPLLDGGVVIAVSSGNMLSVHALADGRPLWDRPIGSINTPWLAGDSMYLISSDNTLVCLLKFSGKIRWATKLPNFANMEEKQGPIIWHGPVVVDGKVAVSGSQGELELVNAIDGKVIETKPIEPNIYTAPVIAGGRMYLVGQDATLYSLQ